MRISVNSFYCTKKFQVTESSFTKRTWWWVNHCAVIPIRDRKNPSRSNSWGVPVLDLGFNQSRRYRGDFVFSRKNIRKKLLSKPPQSGSSSHWAPLASPPLYIGRGTTDIEFATALTHLQLRRITTRWATYIQIKMQNRLKKKLWIEFFALIHKVLIQNRK